MSAIPFWWEYLNHGGLVIAPGQFEEHFLGALPPLSDSVAEKLRRAVTRLEEGDAAVGPPVGNRSRRCLGPGGAFLRPHLEAGEAKGPAPPLLFEPKTLFT